MSTAGVVEEEEIIEVFQESGDDFGLKATEIAEELGYKTTEGVRYRLNQMFEAGQLRRKQFGSAYAWKLSSE